MIRLPLKWTAVIFVLLILLSRPIFLAQAQTPIQIDANQAQLTFPKEIRFKVSAHSSSRIEKITLSYGTNGRTCLTSAARQSPSFAPDTWVTAEWTWDLVRDNSLPPGAEVWWQWLVQDSSGNSFTTDRQTIKIEDRTYSWKSLKQGKVELYWSEGDQAFGQALLDISLSSLNRLEQQAGMQAEGVVRLNIYPSAGQMKNAATGLPEWAGGVAYPEYGSVLLGVGPGDLLWSARSLPHEIAHLVSGQRIFNCLGNTLPTWLEEGLAVYAEGPLEDRRVEAVSDALQKGSLPSLRSLTGGFAADPEKAELGYSQSAVMVQYLLDEYGADKMEALLAAVKEGALIDPALRRVYGLDTAGLDAAWRTARGYAQPAQPESAATVLTAPKQATAVPTLALWTPAFGSPATLTPVPPSPIPSPTDPPASPTTAAAAAVTPSPTPAPSAGPTLAYPVIFGGAAAMLFILLAVFFLRRKESSEKGCQ